LITTVCKIVLIVVLICDSDCQVL